MRVSHKLGVVAAIVLAAGMGIAGPAQAQQGRELGAKNCVSGSVATSARATGSQAHQQNNDYKTFLTSAAYVTRTFYSGIKNVTSSRVDVSGSLSSASIFCDL